MEQNRRLTEAAEEFEERLQHETRRAEKRRLSAANRAELEVRIYCALPAVIGRKNGKMFQCSISAAVYRLPRAPPPSRPSNHARCDTYCWYARLAPLSLLLSLSLSLLLLLSFIVIVIAVVFVIVGVAVVIVSWLVALFPC